jgi:hypothetical protein
VTVKVKGQSYRAQTAGWESAQGRRLSELVAVSRRRRGRGRDYWHHALLEHSKGMAAQVVRSVKAREGR